MRIFYVEEQLAGQYQVRAWGKIYRRQGQGYPCEGAFAVVSKDEKLWKAKDDAFSEALKVVAESNHTPKPTSITFIRKPSDLPKCQICRCRAKCDCRCHRKSKKGSSRK